MTSSLAIVFPVFALIALGYGFGRSGRFGPGVVKGITEFTFTLAVPALMFKTVATASFPAGAAVGVWASFFGALAVGWLLATVATRTVLGRPSADAAAISLSATYGNVVMLGIPLCYNAYGPAAATAIAILMTLHTPTLWFAGSLHMALASGDENRRSVPELLYDVGRELVRNPIVLAVIGGIVWQWTGIGLDPTIDRTLGLLGQAGIPCSLVALGLSLVAFEIKGQAPTLALIIVTKQLAVPLVAATLAGLVFQLDPVTTGVVVLFAATPAGANAYLFASRYQRAVNSTSGAVALGTILAAPATALIIYLLSA